MHGHKLVSCLKVFCLNINTRKGAITRNRDEILFSVTREREVHVFCVQNCSFPFHRSLNWSVFRSSIVMMDLLVPRKPCELPNLLPSDRLVGLVVRRPPRERKIPGSNPACAGIFGGGSSHTSDFKIGTPVATLPGAWRYRVSAGTGRPGVSIL